MGEERTADGENLGPRIPGTKFRLSIMEMPKTRQVIRETYLI